MALSFVGLYLTSRLRGTPGTIRIRAVKSIGFRIPVILQLLITLGLFLAPFLAGYGFTPPDRRVYMNDFRWDLVWFGVGAAESASLVVTVSVLQRSLRVLRRHRTRVDRQG